MSQLKNAAFPQPVQGSNSRDMPMPPSSQMWTDSSSLENCFQIWLKSFLWQLLSQWVFSICSYLIFEEFVSWYLQSKLRQSSQKCQNFSVACWFLWDYLILIKTFSLFALTVVLLFFFLGFFLCSSLTMCLFRLKAELNVLEHSLHRCLSATLTFFSLMKVPKPAADFTFFTWFSLCDDLFSLVFTCLSYPYFDVCLVSHLSQFQDYFTLSGFCLCTCFLCLSTFDLTSLS